MIPIVLTAQHKSVVVLELFTSQGCSSCPPADQLLDIVSENEHVIGLSYHVDYWNYIGWKDPFSKVEYSNKQRTYGTKFNSSSIYTPQVVVNGKEHFVGSNTAIMKRKLDEYLDKESMQIITINSTQRNNNQVTFNYDISGSIDNTTLSVILVLDEKTTKVNRGENRKRTLKNSNIVIVENQFKINQSQGEGSVLIPEFIDSSDKMSLVLITRNNKLDVIGASKLSL
ncbi:DUF1223 domain-containing protein [Ichthyenterobacterium sp. W332]|uniref:DUF1223 domain-containing protein n=1 Tax=Microcosmobacter mediterraneus TaxID=3075607 RepID=A0ABU2YQ48_9FLAO|nr:DUF1223 domain-containing protein [Ichthyenterobacterium sp. W332]MDT0559183.1 DUF1223 domain-containing protein [Ichthyenterobacterium sp. W332]